VADVLIGDDIDVGGCLGDRLLVARGCADCLFLEKPQFFPQFFGRRLGSKPARSQ
jgi:hypothetical protein